MISEYGLKKDDPAWHKAHFVLNHYRLSANQEAIFLDWKKNNIMVVILIKTQLWPLYTMIYI